MSIQKYLESLPLHEIKKYDRKADYSKTCIPFTGTPRKHPYDTDKMLLINNPYSSETIFYEFRFSDIKGVNDLPSLLTESGESVKMVQVWVEKGSIGMRYEPFEVNEPLKFFKDSEILHQAYSES